MSYMPPYLFYSQLHREFSAGEEPRMKLTEYFLAQLERETAGTRKALERVPEGKNNWKPHEKSMELGYLAALVAKMPSWIAMIVQQDELDFASRSESSFVPKAQLTKADLVRLLDDSSAEARAALNHTNDEHLITPFRFRVGERVVSEEPRHVMIQDSVFNHLSHHRGQLTVYLRLAGASVPAIYGPSADEGKF
jgi:uncharacterized damage-inducible protein DinB